MSLRKNKHNKYWEVATDMAGAIMGIKKAMDLEVEEAMDVGGIENRVGVTAIFLVSRPILHRIMILYGREQ